MRAGTGVAIATAEVILENVANGQNTSEKTTSDSQGNTSPYISSSGEFPFLGEVNEKWENRMRKFYFLCM
ncbi:hypothetical protein [Oceanobacillus kimchii]|uniref:Uncharacterized protein n=1 Tax=Oceanobacillus kimchii TaxID=746691 RepID=A0ABQ5TPU9_9BACI|nr:hypothetical protein [Oceanobacillus kimchii]GLO68446.1 hypothetical protein MACH08_42300 [Oceanobacillus kimchii]